MPPCACGHVTSQREHASPRQSLDEGALECPAVRKLLEALSVLDIVLPLPIVHMHAVFALVDSRAMSLSGFPVAFVFCVVLPGEDPKAVIRTIHEISFVSIVVCPPAYA